MRVVKLLIFITWIILTGILLSRDFFIPELSNKETPLLKNGREEQYYGIWFQNQRIGYVSEKLQASNDNKNQLTLSQKAFMTLTVLNTSQTITMQLHATLDPGLHLQNFQFQFQSPFYSMKAKGDVSNSIVNFTLDTGRTIIQDKIELPRPPMLEINNRSSLLAELPTKGDKAKISSFDPISLTGKDITVEYLGREKILIQDRIHSLHSFVKTFSGIRIKFWLNDQGKVIKEQSAAGFTFLAEPKFKAMDVNSIGSDLLSSVAVSYTGELPLPKAQNAVYKLTFPIEAELELEGGRQTLRDTVLTITRETIPTEESNPVHTDCDDKNSIQPSMYVQSDHLDIKKLAAEIIGKEQNKTKQVQLLISWVFTNIEKRPVIGLPDALTTMKNKKGDCNEHAALFAALSRSIGIPTTIATGVTLFRGAFYYHAWNEVCVNSVWISLDSTNNQFPADLTHIRFARGDMAQQIKIGALLGKLAIEIINPDKVKNTAQ
jgi:hypothetical protein